MKFVVIPTGPLNEATVYVLQIQKLKFFKLWLGEPKTDNP